MKATQINPANISIAIVYCLFGVLAFFVLKIAAKYFKNNNKQSTTLQGKSVLLKDVRKLSFSKIFLKTYFLKSTLVGSMFNKDKKYLLREIFVLSCIGVSCFKINSFIVWPWAVGFGVYILTLIISDIVIPTILNNSQHKPSLINHSPQQQQHQHINSTSIQIQHTQLHLSISSKRQITLNNAQPNKQLQPSLTTQRYNIIFITVTSMTTQVLLCYCILTLSMSVSNSGVLNLISLGVAVVVDQLVARVGFGLGAYVVCVILHKTQAFSFFENQLFLTYCQQVIVQDVYRICKQNDLEEMNNKIANSNKRNEANEKISGTNQRLSQSNEDRTEMKLIHPSVFQQVADLVPVSIVQTLQVDALLQQENQSIQEENYQDDQLKMEVGVEEIQQKGQEQDQKQDEIQQIDKKQRKKKDSTNYYELFPYDIEMFTSQTLQQVKHPQRKNPKKKLHTHQKFKSDPHLYFPYQQHKLSHKQKPNQTINTTKHHNQENYLSSIDILDFIDDTMIHEQPQIGMILQEKNLNIKTLVVNEKPQIPPTSRPNYSTVQKQQKQKQSMSKTKKISPYLVNLSSQAIRPLKLKKVNVTKNNKENANQTNKSFMTSDGILMSGVTQKENSNFQTINTENQYCNGR